MENEKDTSIIFPDLEKSIKEFEKSMAGLEEVIKLLKSDINKPFDIIEKS